MVEDRYMYMYVHVNDVYTDNHLTSLVWGLLQLILICGWSIVTTCTCTFMAQGQPDPLNSAFHLTYNMVLNLLRVEEINPEYMLERSFYQFQNNSTIPIKQKS